MGFEDIGKRIDAILKAESRRKGRACRNMQKILANTIAWKRQQIKYKIENSKQINIAGRM